MKKQFLFAMFLAIGVVGFCSGATIPYSTDFSTNPGWLTDQPSNLYWDSASESYFVHSEYPGYVPSRYAYALLPEAIGSFNLEWDVKVVRADGGASAIQFGIYDNHLGDFYAGGEYIWLHAGASGSNSHWWCMSISAGGINAETGTPISADAWSIGEWYTCTMTYDSVLSKVDIQIKTRDDQQEIWTSNLSVPGAGFTNELKYLGTVGNLPYASIAEGYIDNVNLTPEPATLLLLGMGGLVLRKRRAG